MATWAFRPVTPAGSSFSGEMVYNMTNVEVPNTFCRYVDSLSVVYPNYNINKESGFLRKKYRRKAASGDDVEAEVSLMLAGDIPRWLRELLETIAKGCSGGGMHVDLYDDWATDKQYTCRWVNSGDFVDNTELLCGGSMDLLAFKIQSV